MDFPNNPAEGDTIRVNGQRYIAKSGVWEKNNGDEVVIVSNGIIDLTKGSVHAISLSGTSVSLSVINPLATGFYDDFMLEIVLSAATNVTYPSSFKWDKQTQPSLPATGRAIIAGFTRDGGARWEMVIYSSDSK